METKTKWRKRLRLQADDTFSTASIAFYNRGMVKNGLKDHNGAIADFDRVIELNPKYADAYFGRGLANENLENYKDAVADFDRAIKLEPSDKAYREARQQAQQKLDNS